jgi:DNA-binding transcriptional LysR family regulator
MNAPSPALLEVLIAAAESRSYSEAARKLGLSQGSVSIKLKALQAQLSLPLFTVKGKKNVLTHYGREVYEFAKRNADRLNAEYEALSRKYASAENLSVSIGCRRELFEKLAPRIDFEGRIVHRPLSARDATAALLDRKIDVAITYERPDSTDLVAKKVLESKAHLIVHRKFLKGAGKSFLTSPDFFASRPCVLYDTQGHLLSDWVEHLRLSLSDLKARMVTEDWRTLQRLVEEGQGYAVVPDYVLPQSRDVEIHPLPESVLPKYAFYAVFYRDLLGVSAIKGLLDSLGPQGRRFKH